MATEALTINTTVKSSVNKVWAYWTDVNHIIKWNQASSDWECPLAENDFKVGGRFVFRMQAKDKSAGFDFSGQYQEIVPKNLIKYVTDDGREVTVTFEQLPDNAVKITESFEPEKINSLKKQQQGWFSILNNFKNYAENN